jgi:hypothetical protein
MCRGRVDSFLRPLGYGILDFMRRFVVALTATVVTMSANSAGALPTGPTYPRPSLIVAAADDCGVNRYRDASGVCRRTRQIARPRKQLYGSCGGMNAHRVCNWSGQCWMVCD